MCFQLLVECCTDLPAPGGIRPAPWDNHFQRSKYLTFGLNLPAPDSSIWPMRNRTKSSGTLPRLL